jgi:hypothetical protein
LHSRFVIFRLFAFVVWSIRTCVSLPRWVLGLIFHGSLSPECGPFGKLKRRDRFRGYDFRHNYFPILYLISSGK